jgi:hypothetical protein
VRVEERMEFGVVSKEQEHVEHMNTKEIRLLVKEDEQCSVTNYLTPSLALPSGISASGTSSQAQVERQACRGGPSWLPKDA